MRPKAEPIVLVEKTVLVEMKRCVSCGTYKELTGYVRDTRAKNGYKGSCKSCENFSRKRNLR
ncbi:hypothetical protein ACWGJQ_21975 [Peribacillus simplex]